MVEIENLQKIHIDFIDWLISKKSTPNIEAYISYVIDKLKLYEQCLKTEDIRLIQDIPRDLNRYRDEFEFDSESIKKAYGYFDKMRKEIEMLSSK